MNNVYIYIYYEIIYILIIKVRKKMINFYMV